MKDAVATMGAILPDDVGGRDAVHVAVISVVADDPLRPGMHVGFVDKPQDNGKVTCDVRSDKWVGIVDPFIEGKIMPGQRFWLYLYPRTITSLRHQWTHPAFSDDIGTTYNTPTQRLAAEQWLRNFVDRSDLPGYEVVMAKVAEIADEGGSDYFIIYGSDANGEIPDEFWVMAEIVLGREIKGQKPSYFSCSC